MGTMRMLNQESLFSSLEADDQMFCVGDTLFRVTLGEVEPLQVTETFDCTDFRNPFAGKTVRYRASTSTGCGDCFGKYDVGVRYFTTEEEALARAAATIVEKNVRTISVDPADADEWVSYREKAPFDASGRQLYACCARFGCMVYRKGWYSYRFLDEHADEKTAKRAYREEASLLLGDFSGKPSDHERAPLETRLLYGKGDGKWSDAEYAYDNLFGGMQEKYGV